MSVHLSQFFSLYLETARDHAEKMQNALYILSHKPTDKSSLEIVHLNSHSLKSQSMLMGFPTMGELCFHIEKYMKLVRDGSATLDSHQVRALMEAVKAIQASLTEIEQTKTEVNMTGQIVKLRMALKQPEIL